jgi:probable F420-dependent oxidoreductase
VQVPQLRSVVSRIGLTASHPNAVHRTGLYAGGSRSTDAARRTPSGAWAAMMRDVADHRFRFGVVAGLSRTAEEWAALARRAEDLGYDSLLIPDTLNTLSPFAALAVAATSTQCIRVGTYVLSAPNRPPAMVAWESASLDLLTNGRFELGLGAGRPGAAQDAETLGVDFGSAHQRIQRVVDTIRAVKGGTAIGPMPVQQPHPPILVAARAPLMLRVAAEHADVVALALPPDADGHRLAATVAQLREIAGTRFDDLELHLNVAAVAATPDDVPDWVSRMVNGDPRAMAARGGIGFLTGSQAKITDTLHRRRDELSISYVAVNAMFMDGLAPVVAHLAAS